MTKLNQRWSSASDYRVKQHSEYPLHILPYRSIVKSRFHHYDPSLQIGVALLARNSVQMNFVMVSAFHLILAVFPPFAELIALGPRRYPISVLVLCFLLPFFFVAVFL
jgi:hypothetical protein